MTLSRHVPLRNVPHPGTAWNSTLKRAGLRSVPPWASSVPALPGPAVGTRGAKTKSAATRRRAGFPAAVKLLVRTRAGSGDPAEARCEAHGGWLGPRGGEFQHIVARGMGGCRRPLINSAANCALLCSRCHRLAESRDPHMEAAGFWARQGTDPRMVPMMLASEDGSGALVWRTADGRYLYQEPKVEAA